MNERSISEQFNHLVNIFQSKKFLECQILCNDVPFFIAEYKISDENDVCKMRSQLIKKLKESNITVLDINIYDLSIEYLKETGDWDWYIKNEQSISKKQLKEDLQSILDIKEVIMPRIKRMVDNTEFDLLFIDGIGEVFPYIRSHSLLSNLQNIVSRKPLVMFYPGSYQQTATTGSSFKLFDICDDGQEYKAANIYEIQGV